MSDSDQTPPSPYQVLARKYRPQSFHELVGQDSLVQILGNAIKTKRLPHALILTGVRGVGKTTTARLLARGLNCIGPEGAGNETMSPCGVCPPCKSLLNESLLDVIEMDAASRTGVDDVREIIEAARYKPLSARYKIYIIDEVHMLSKSAFNALLKTLEEPPTHVKFIFATTEIHKVPDTVLSRCMRFDLQRVKLEDLVSLLTKITEKEGFSAEKKALSLLARAGNGSARDSLSLLDQALSLNPGKLTFQDVRKMLHLSDQKAILALLKDIFEGHPQKVLEAFNHLYNQGSDPLTLIEQLLESTHWLQILALGSNLSNEMISDSQDFSLGKDLAKSLSVPLLARLWQGLGKGHQEVKIAADPFRAAHMVLIRLCYLAELPTPGEALSRLVPSSNNPAETTPQSSSPKSRPSIVEKPPPQERKQSNVSHDVSSKEQQEKEKSYQTRTKENFPEAVPEQPLSLPVTKNNLAQHQTDSPTLPDTFEDLLTLVSTHREPLLAINLKNDSHILDYKPGFLTLYLTKTAPKDFVPSLKKNLEAWTKSPWQITVSETPGTGSPREIEDEKKQAKIETLKQQPIVKKALEFFPEGTLQPLTT